MKRRHFSPLALSLAALSAPLFSSLQAADKASKDDGKLRIICFGAHPDDAEYKSGGTAAKWAAMGHHVKMVSVTNGDIGHWKEAGGVFGSDEKMAKIPSPDDKEARFEYMKKSWSRRNGREADKYRDLLIKFYGKEHGEKVKHAETFEICEYGRQPSAADIKKLFPFYGK
ncbi:MAG: PIG-L family deacetylase [Verrucomicrobiales bacterium]|nr:PIG-L family deacetylase [Verrucomicrobiales bacterium]